MKCNKWTLALAAAGVLSLGINAQAEEAQHQVMTALSSTTLSGYVDTSANWRIGKTDGFIPGRSFDNADKQDGFNLNVVKLTLEKPLDEGQWSAGYKVDLLFGPDAAYYSSTLHGGGMNNDDFAVKQAYASFRVPVGNGIDFKMGAFDTIIGYESFESVNNPNFSRSYGWYLEPWQHTGLLANYTIVENVSIAGGIADTPTGGVNQRANRAGVPADQSEKTYLGSITVSAPDSWGFLAGSTLYGAIVDGLAGNEVDTTWYYGGVTLNTPVTGLAVGGAFDYREDGLDFGGIGDSWAWAGAGYVSYQATEKLKFAFRGDYTKGSDGTYYMSSVAGDQNELLGLTLTVDYALWANLITRLEGRWDHALGEDIYGNAPGSTNGQGNPDENVFTVALNAIYKF